MSLRQFYKKYETDLVEKLGRSYQFPELLRKLSEFDIAINDHNDKLHIERFFLGITENAIRDFFSPKGIKKMHLAILEENLIPFAMNEHSNFAFWLQEGKTTDKLPIISISNDGILQLDASNLQEFFRLILVGKSYFSIDDETLQLYLDKYDKWLKKDLSINCVKNKQEIEQIHSQAKESYEISFNAWLKNLGYIN